MIFLKFVKKFPLKKVSGIKLNGKSVAPFVFGVTCVAFDPVELNRVNFEQIEKSAP